MKILTHLNEIKRLQPMNQRLFYNIEHWKNYDFENEAIQNDIDLITQNFKNGISRQEIIDFLSNDKISLRLGFILVMIWGHGFSENGRADNRGPWKVKKMFENFSNSEIILDNSSKRLKANDIIGAHKSFNGMNRCRVNFFSKFLYFLGRAKDMERYPLIFDARVANTIAILNSKDSDISSILNITPKQDAKSYSFYVDLIHEIALENNVEAEKIEYFLFNGV